VSERGDEKRHSKDKSDEWFLIKEFKLINGYKRDNN
jgi:hypothetical protein